ncbi:hypothetical protein KAU43_08605 [candidate division WOR-3 bacterium]|nr:hypothetical protein [candidate division WOR-3 bacterium]
MQIIPNSVSKVNTFEVVNYASNVIALHKEMVYILHIYIIREWKLQKPMRTINVMKNIITFTSILSHQGRGNEKDKSFPCLRTCLCQQGRPLMTRKREELIICLTNIMELYNIMNDSGIINKEGL